MTMMIHLFLHLLSFLNVSWCDVMVAVLVVVVKKTETPLGDHVMMDKREIEKYQSSDTKDTSYTKHVVPRRHVYLPIGIKYERHE